MAYTELQEKLHKLIFKAAWDSGNFSDAEKKEVLRMQELQKEYPEYITERATAEWYKRHIK